jgi:hypothetical protein
MRIRDNEKLLKLLDWYDSEASYTISSRHVDLEFVTDRSVKDKFDLTKHHAYDESFRLEICLNREDFSISYDDLLKCTIDGDYIDVDDLEIVRYRRNDTWEGRVFKDARRDSER